MLIAHMVVDDVHDHLHALEVAGFYQLNVFLIRTQSRIDAVMVGHRIAVIRFVGLIVFEHGVQPQGRNAQIDQVIQMIDHALQVAAVAKVHLPTMNAHLVQVEVAIVRVIAIRETIGH